MIKLYQIIKKIFYRIFVKLCSTIKCRFYIIPKNFYQPIPEEEDLTGGFFESTSEMIGIDLNNQFSLDLLHNIFPVYIDEFRQLFPKEVDTRKTKHEDFILINGSFMAIDAHVYYTFIRHFKPRRIVEIGGGNSSILAQAACLKNLASSAVTSKISIIEPYPTNHLKQSLKRTHQLIERKVQNVDISFFKTLCSGDILFIDSSHTLRSGGDVQYEYLEILPRLAPGVLVHVHDISLPKNYPKIYSETGLYWNEQYLLQAFLAFNSRFEVIWPGNYMLINYPQLVQEVFPEYHLMREHYPQSEPTSFWMRVKP